MRALGSESKAEAAFRLLEELIVTGGLPPGASVTEMDLANRVGLARTPVREAIRLLAEMGLVQILPRRGLIVAPIDIRSFLLMLETRRALDRLIAASAARRATTPKRREFGLAAEAMTAAAADGDLALYLEIDERFDRLMAEAADNPFAAKAAAPLHAHSRRFWYVHGGVTDLNAAAGLHVRLMRAIENRDDRQAAAAADAIVDDLERAAFAVVRPR